MMDRLNPPQMRQRPPLAARDGDERIVRVVAMQLAQIVDVLSSMNGGQRSIHHVREQGQMKAVQMEVQNIETRRALPNLGEHR